MSLCIHLLKHALSNPPVVSFPDFTLPSPSTWTLQALLLVLCWLKNRDSQKGFACASHVLSKAERKWSAYDRELCPIVCAVRQFCHCLYTQHSVIVTDHKPLLGIRKIPIDNVRTGRREQWALELDRF